MRRDRILRIRLILIFLFLGSSSNKVSANDEFQDAAYKSLLQMLGNSAMAKKQAVCEIVLKKGQGMSNIDSKIIGQDIHPSNPARRMLVVLKTKNTDGISTRRYWFAVSCYRETWVIKNNVTRNAVFDFSNLQKVRTNIIDIKDDLYEPQNIAQIWNGNYKRGEIVTKTMLSPRPMIIAGESVDYIVHVGSIRISTHAIAKSNSTKDGKVMLKLENKRKTFEARVVSRGVAINE